MDLRNTTAGQDFTISPSATRTFRRNSATGIALACRGLLVSVARGGYSWVSRCALARLVQKASCGIPGVSLQPLTGSSGIRIGFRFQ